ncbi:MAG: hypothetical protein QXF01_00465 [Candidatus Micrarchaeaceae archaeon]
MAAIPNTFYQGRANLASDIAEYDFIHNLNSGGYSCLGNYMEYNSSCIIPVIRYYNRIYGVNLSIVNKFSVGGGKGPVNCFQYNLSGSGEICFAGD